MRSAAAKKQRVADTLAWRERRKRGAAVYPVEVDGQIFDLLQRFVGLPSDKIDDKQAVAGALGKLLQLALAALQREANARR